MSIPAVCVSCSQPLDEEGDCVNPDCTASVFSGGDFIVDDDDEDELYRDGVDLGFRPDEDEE